jgi:hypothetical protein
MYSLNFELKIFDIMLIEECSIVIHYFYYVGVYVYDWMYMDM